MYKYMHRKPEMSRVPACQALKGPQAGGGSGGEGTDVAGTLLVRSSSLCVQLSTAVVRRLVSHAYHLGKLNAGWES